VDINLEVGGTSETVTVSARIRACWKRPSGSGTASLEQRQISDLPVMSNSAILWCAACPACNGRRSQTYLGMHSNAGGSAISGGGRRRRQ
jgi:hypothetical protein